MSKIILPEREEPKTLGVHISPYYEKESNIFEAIINGANSGVKMIVGVVALLIAVLGIVSLLNLFISYIGGKLNSLIGSSFEWSLEGILGYIFYPFSFVIGIPKEDAGVISKIIAQRTILTEVVAYKNLALALKHGAIHNIRSAYIASYALCGFAHLASMAIFVGGLTSLIPSRVRTVSALALRSLLAATLACLLTARVAGIFITDKSLLF